MSLHWPIMALSSNNVSPSANSGPLQHICLSTSQQWSSEAKMSIRQYWPPPIQMSIRLPSSAWMHQLRVHRELMVSVEWDKQPTHHWLGGFQQLWCDNQLITHLLSGLKWSAESCKNILIRDRSLWVTKMAAGPPRLQERPSAVPL